MYYVVYNNSEVFWCFEEEAKELTKGSYKLYAITDTIEKADILCEQVCYF
jgi:hypothetical protein